jgi:hypothetical protein
VRSQQFFGVQGLQCARLEAVRPARLAECMVSSAVPCKASRAALFQGSSAALCNSIRVARLQDSNAALKS